MNKKFIYIPVLFLLFGCSENISPVDSGLANQIYHHGNGSEPQGIDPHVVTGVPEHHILISLCEGLTIPNPNPNDMNGYMAGTAETWSISDDGKEYIFNINKNALPSKNEQFLRKIVKSDLAENKKILEETIQRVSSKVIIKEHINSNDYVNFDIINTYKGKTVKYHLLDCKNGYY